jgi:hypothetical protein
MNLPHEDMSSSNQDNQLDFMTASSPSLPLPTTLVTVASTIESVSGTTTPLPPATATSTAVTPTTATVVNLTVGNNENRNKAKGRKYFDDELVHLLCIMERVLPIGPDEWDEVLQEHSSSFPGRDVESLCCKYTNLHRKKVQTGDPNCPPVIKLAKRVKYMIGDRAELGDGEELYDMEKDRFDGSRDGGGSVNRIGNIAVPSVVHTANAVRVRDDVSFASSPQGITNNEMSARGSRASNNKNNLMNFMLLQMQLESKERDNNRRERAEDRRAVTNVITTIAAGYFGSKKGVSGAK